MIEGKILAVPNWVHLGHRDLVDIFLYRDALQADSREQTHLRLEIRTAFGTRQNDINSPATNLQ